MSPADHVDHANRANHKDRRHAGPLIGAFAGQLKTSERNEYN